MESQALPVAAKRFELKYVFDSRISSSIADWANHCLIADPKYPNGKISSIYFDNYAMASYHEKRSSEFIKSKLRIRWYDSGPTRPDDDRQDCFLERKSKIGPRTIKSRVPVQIARDHLVNPFTNELSLRHALANAAADLGCPLLLTSPVILIEYNRRRFLDPDSGSRVAIDTSIQATGSHAASWIDTTHSTLDVGVVEIKGVQRALPRPLRSISSLLVRESFSKYGRCCEMLSQPISRRT